MAKKKYRVAECDLFKQLDWVSIEKVNWLSDDSKAEQGIRIYCTSANQTWSLQVRAPMKLANGRIGKDYVVATASLPKATLRMLRDEIDRQIAQQEGR